MSIQGLGFRCLPLWLISVVALLLIDGRVGLAQSNQELHEALETPLATPNKSKATVGGAVLPPPIEQRTNIRQNCYLLQDQSGQEIRPMAIVKAGDEVYFLGPRCLWLSKGVKAGHSDKDILVLARFDPPSLLPWHEFNDFVYSYNHRSLIILDKSGDLFSFNLAAKTWSSFRANRPQLGAPDPDYVALCLLIDGIALLDPERNQIWKTEGAYLLPCFKEVLPWHVKEGQVYLADGIGISFAGDLFVLKQDGRISHFQGVEQGRIYQKTFSYIKPKRMRPSRLMSDGRTVLYIVERENNRVIKIDRTLNESKQFVFDASCDLRGIVPSGKGFWIINGNEILCRKGTDFDQWTKKPSPYVIDSRLKGLILPIAGQHLPRHLGVYPGARRLYRFGVHEGLDMFNDPGARIAVVIGTPVRAAAGGKVIRADTSFADMDRRTFNRVMSECLKEHRTSEKNEDLFRGRQVWIDHGNGLITRYAHLSKVNPFLKVNTTIKQGDLLGCVGVSGTGENLPGRIPYPHLHFEIRLDGKYLGYGLTPAEVMGLYQDIFKSGG